MAEISLNPDPLTVERKRAAADYLAALQSHGVKPDGFAWALDGNGEFHLLLVTSLVDRVGPKTVYDTLFKAYDRALTPKTIDPWIVSAFSPKSDLGKAFISMIDISIEFKDESGNSVDNFAHVTANIGPFTIRSNWIYVKVKQAKSAEAQLRGWHRFTSDVERVAA